MKTKQKLKQSDVDLVVITELPEENKQFLVKSHFLA
jgi:hypothetical protein